MTRWMTLLFVSVLGWLPMGASAVPAFAGQTGPDAGRVVKVWPQQTQKITALMLVGKSPKAPAGSPVTLDAGTRQISWSFDYSGLAPEDKISWTIYLGARKLSFPSVYSTNDLVSNKRTKSGTVKVQTPIDGGFAPGFYRLELKVNDQLEQTGEFLVEPQGKVPTFANVIFAASVSASGDQVKYPVTVKYDFDPSAGELFAVFDHFNLDRRAKTWGWRLSREGATVDEKLDHPWPGRAEGTFALPLIAPNQPGVYDLDLFLNGKWATAGSFTVGQAQPDAGRLIQSDDFLDPKSGWTVQKTGSNSADYVDGQFVVSLGQDMQSWSSMSGKRFSDGIAEIEATPMLDTQELITQLADGFQHFGWYGLVARFQDSNNFYLFVVQPTGKYAILLDKNNSMQRVKDWTQVVQDVYPFGMVKTIRLRMLAQGPMLRFYINDRLVDVLPDAVWTDGLAGAVASAEKDRSMKVAFDHWRLWSLSASQPSAAAGTPQSKTAGNAQHSETQGPNSASSSPATDGATTVAGAPGIRLDVASWVPKRDATYGWWGVAPAGQSPDKKTKFSNTDDALDLPPGQYDVYWVQDYDHGSSPLLMAKNVNVTGQGRVALRVDSGVQLDLASWAPKLDPSYGWWGAVAAGEKPNKRINWMNTPGALLLPPGEYDVYWAQDYDHGSTPILIAPAVAVEPGAGPIRLSVDSGLQVKAAPWVAPLDSSYGWWGAVEAGQKPDRRVNWTHSAPAIVVPPGEYDVYWQQDYDHGSRPLLLAAKVKVAQGQLSDVEATSGIRLELPANTPPLDKSYGWWGVAPAGKTANDRVAWWTGITDAPLLAAPGQYDLYWKQDYSHPPQLLQQNVTVTAGALLELQAQPKP
jgi:hypothetical protein